MSKQLNAGDAICGVDEHGEANGESGVVIRSLADDLTYDPGSYECDLGHGYLVVRHESEIRLESPHSSDIQVNQSCGSAARTRLAARHSINPTAAASTSPNRNLPPYAEEIP